jgi:hypothetical protein
MTRKRADIAKHGRFNGNPAQDANTARLQRISARIMADSVERGELVSVPDSVAMLRACAMQPWRGRPSKGTTQSMQRAAIVRAADCIERGEPFNVETVAGALRRWAKSRRNAPARVGRPPKVDHAAVALEFESQRRRRDVSDARIIRELAEKYDVDVSTIKEARIACGDAAQRHFDVLFANFGAKWIK